jgi:2-oxoglutarate ferredoxin oxidoreductase subunit alpha
MGKDVLTGVHFLSGNHACAEGAIAAGCRYYAGYPITPSNEIAERMSWRLPQVGGIYIQMEDEIASMAAIVGASWGGARSMTATSGPGFSLMQENLGLAVMTEAPCVIVDVQRGSPSTGLPTLVAQADVMQARWGSHGDYATISISPSSPQECFDFMIKAFNLAETWRVPVVMLSDESIAHLSERVVIPDKSEIKTVFRKVATGPKEGFLPFKRGFRIHLPEYSPDIDDSAVPKFQISIFIIIGGPLHIRTRTEFFKKGESVLGFVWEFGPGEK